MWEWGSETRADENGRRTTRARSIIFIQRHFIPFMGDIAFELRFMVCFDEVRRISLERQAPRWHTSQYALPTGPEGT